MFLYYLHETVLQDYQQYSAYVSVDLLYGL